MTRRAPKKTPPALSVDCQYCKQPAKFMRDSSKLFGRDFGPLWRCDPCDAHVGCHPDGSPKGTLANAALRSHRKSVHAVFDPLWRDWKSAYPNLEECSKKLTYKMRARAYEWLGFQMGLSADRAKGLHSIGDLDPERRFIMHFPEELAIKSIGSGYGGNALLGKKCHALRIASWQAREEGWLAEHMLLMGLQSPEGKTHYIAAAFPSACGKTNLAMLVPPASMPGWKIWTLGDDISWLHVDAEGQLRAINPESGYFGVVPGTNRKTNRNAFDMIQRDTIFTNVAVTEDNQPWWEGLETGTPAFDWQGKPYTPGNGPAAHPNSRFTVSAKQNPIYSTLADAPEGVPISAILFGGRRREVAPLVYEARSWAHGVLVGAGMASETTAAAVGQMGVVRRDSMAMKPFAGYNFADYWDHWLKLGSGPRASKLPKIFHVNWFRQDRNGRFLWPGFGENLRVLRWIADRCEGKVPAVETPIGVVPRKQDLDISGLDMDPSTLDVLLSIDSDAWRQEVDAIGKYLAEFGNRVPSQLHDELKGVARRLEGANAA